MLRKIIFISFLTALFSCHSARGTFAISQLRQSDHTITGAIEVNHPPKKQSCEQVVKNRIIDKFLYEGFENTSYWRPRTYLLQSNLPLKFDPDCLKTFMLLEMVLQRKVR